MNRDREYAEARKVIEGRDKVCANCGSRENIEMHHIVPLSQGGSNKESNLVYLCFDCHGKAHTTRKVRNGVAEESKVINTRVPNEVKDSFQGVDMREFLTNLVKQRDRGYLRIEEDKLITPWMKEW